MVIRLVKMAVKKGDKVKVEYEGTLEDGSVFDSSERHGEPLEFTAGGGQMIKGFDDAVIGMEKGDEKNIELSSSEAYGDRNEQLVRDVPKEQLPKGIELKKGMMLGMMLPNGAQLPAKVVGLSEKGATLDMNHPLAGKTLKFRIKLVGIDS